MDVQGAVWSEYYNSWIGDTNDNYVIGVRIEPLTESYRVKMDWRFYNDNTYYEYKGYYFDNNIKKNILNNENFRKL